MDESAKVFWADVPAEQRLGALLADVRGLLKEIGGLKAAATLSEAQSKQKRKRDLLELVTIVDALEDVAESLALVLRPLPKDQQRPLSRLKIVGKQFGRWLKERGVEGYEAGEVFDPFQHLAVEAVYDVDKPDGAVLRQVKRGYRLDDQVLRPAHVVVVTHDVQACHGSGQEELD